MRDTYPFLLEPLNYPFYALEPYISEETIKIHYSVLLKNYVDKLNEVLKQYPELQFWSLEQLLSNPSLLPAAAQTTIINNAGGVYNHYLYFDSMTSPSHSQMNNEFSIILRKEFGSLQRFKELFVSAAVNVFGSGYVWLVLNQNLNLAIITTHNQDNPLSFGLAPIMTLDVWEHAFFCDYPGKKKEYAANWFKLIHWDCVYERYKSIYHSNLEIIEGES